MVLVVKFVFLPKSERVSQSANIITVDLASEGYILLGFTDCSKQIT